VTVKSLFGFGEPEGIGKRLAGWASQLGRDRKYPWVGTGLIDDLKCAAKLLGADPEVLFPSSFDPKPVPLEEDEFANWSPPASQDFDL
jgi:hypothetical protein